MLQLIFLTYLTRTLAAVLLRKTKGNEAWLLEPKTTHSVRTSAVTAQRGRESQPKLFKGASGRGRQENRPCSTRTRVSFCSAELPARRGRPCSAVEMVQRNNRTNAVKNVSLPPVQVPLPGFVAVPFGLQRSKHCLK